nr:MAG TPA: hypothetical protein [Caudoviricetes sp.]
MPNHKLLINKSKNFIIIVLSHFIPKNSIHMKIYN